ncbi:MAG: hypothetical protein V7629_12510, partial [Motiliproteus sp.]
ATHVWLNTNTPKTNYSCTDWSLYLPECHQCQAEARPTKEASLQVYVGRSEIAPAFQALPTKASWL